MKNPIEEYKRLASIDYVIRTAGRGVYKRIDENRETLELLHNEAPEFIIKFPWVIGWFSGNDYFFEEIAKASKIDNPFENSGFPYPRPWPEKSTVNLSEAISQSQLNLTLPDRLMTIVNTEISVHNKFTVLESMSSISADAWREFFNGRQKASTAMIEFVANQWPKYALWLCIGDRQRDFEHERPN